MYSITTYREPALVVAEVAGKCAEEEVRGVCRDLDLRLLRREGGPVALLLDLGHFEPQGDALPLLDRFVERSVQAGIRVGRVVESRLVAHQLDRVAEEAGLIPRLRNFGQREAAQDWLKAPGG